MRDAVGNKERWERHRTPTQDPSTVLTWREPSDSSGSWAPEVWGRECDRTHTLCIARARRATALLPFPRTSRAGRVACALSRVAMQRRRHAIRRLLVQADIWGLGVILYVSRAAFLLPWRAACS